MNKSQRMQVYNKYNGRCAYCGKRIKYEEMQVDHIIPRAAEYYGITDHAKIESISNYNPACRRCNHYKRANNLELFREMLKTLHSRVRDIYICKVAEDYGIVEIKPWNGKFYFESEEEG